MKKPVSHRKFHSGGHFPRWRHIFIILRMNSVFIESWHSKACPMVVKTDNTNITKQYWPNSGIYWLIKIVSGEAKPNFETYLNYPMYSRVMFIRHCAFTILFFVLTVLCLTCLYVSFNVFVFIRIIWFVQLFTSAWCLMKLLIHVHSECLILESHADFKQQCSVNSSCSTFINPDSFVFNINVFVSYMFLKYLKLSPECCLLG